VVDEWEGREGCVGGIGAVGLSCIYTASVQIEPLKESMMQKNRYRASTVIN
jgi:hypothetical protein